mmetsp:Transcript_18281/g.57287  ORF Transcript_18281/g.57287 Transcript_18281/m.57287 type:complete len:237 (-) Transcript_18281:391-1101(-)
MLLSASMQILPMIRAASTGKSPTAVSPESMTASLPSSTALATSLASARVGLGEPVMDSSICVAVTTNFPARLQRPIMTFWAMKTCSGGISMPRSPRATMMPSATSRMASKFSSPSPFSIFAMSFGGVWPSLQFFASSVRTSSTLSASWTKESATKSTPWARAKSTRSRSSFAESSGRSTRTPGMLQFFRSPIAASFRTWALTRPCSASSTFVTSRFRAPSPIRMGCPLRTDVGNFA